MSQGESRSEGSSASPAEVFANSRETYLRALAGPGTGKTFAMVRRVTSLLEEGIEPRRILIVTFARAAARDLVEAVAEIEAAGDQLIPRTLHSYCFSLLGREQVLQATGRRPRILQEFEADALLQDLEGEFGGLRDRRKLRTEFEAAWSRAQSDEPGQPVDGLDQAFQDQLIGSLRWHGAMLVGEVVPLALSFLRHHPQASERQAFDHVLVDEYQDLNRAEQQVLEYVSEAGSLSVLGDDDQSIYSFKQANPEGIREFADAHPGTEDVEFHICRRCPHAVVDMAQSLVERNPGRLRRPMEALADNPPGEIHNVQWRSLSEEADGIAAFVQSKIESGVDPAECLVLANRKLIGYELRDAMLARDIPCTSYFREEALDHELAQEALTVLALLANPDDRVALRMWLSFGATTQRRGPYRRALNLARDEGTTVAGVLDGIANETIALSHSTGLLEKWLELEQRREQLRPIQDDLPALIDTLIPNGVEQVALLRELAGQVAEEADTLQSFVDGLRYASSLREAPQDVNEVRVMSFHASKGLTAKLVVLGGLVEGVIPFVDGNESLEDQQNALEEQRRLFFVGMTRTTDILVLSSYSSLGSEAYRIRAVTRGRRGATVSTLSSRFLGELGPSLPDSVRGDSWEY